MDRVQRDLLRIDSANKARFGISFLYRKDVAIVLGMTRILSRDPVEMFESARQPWCDGQVAMWGGSYGGSVQWYTAKELPPHLKTIVPAAASFAGVDFPMWRNVFASYDIQC